jgi:predicted nicotinamide N-methyase
VLDAPDQVRGRDVLDLATGSGLVAIAAARAGAGSVAANDIDPMALAAASANAAANGVRLHLVEGDLLQTDDRYGLVLAGDVCYSREMSGRILAFLRRAAARGALVLIGDPGRAYLPADELTAAASYDIPVVEALESVPVRHATVWRVG